MLEAFQDIHILVTLKSPKHAACALLDVQEGLCALNICCPYENKAC